MSWQYSSRCWKPEVSLPGRASLAGTGGRSPMASMRSVCRRRRGGSSGAGCRATAAVIAWHCWEQPLRRKRLCGSGAHSGDGGPVSQPASPPHTGAPSPGSQPANPAHLEVGIARPGQLPRQHLIQDHAKGVHVACRRRPRLRQQHLGRQPDGVHGAASRGGHPRMGGLNNLRPAASQPRQADGRHGWVRWGGTASRGPAGHKQVTGRQAAAPWGAPAE